MLGVWQGARGQVGEGVLARNRRKSELRRAIDRRQFFLLYQPIVSLSSGSAVGAELLVRWQHPEDGVVMPEKFIPFAERNDLMGPIGDLVIEEACRQLGIWQKAGWQVLPLSVNVSVAQLIFGDFSYKVAKCLEMYKIDPGLLTLEITETLPICEIDEIAMQLGELRARGLRVVLDDFGTGYSSLSHLVRFPVTGLKIDREITREIPGSASAAALVQHLIEMTTELELSITVEGVERDAQADWLRRFAGVSAQGDLFSAPMPLDTFEGEALAEINRC